LICGSPAHFLTVVLSAIQVTSVFSLAGMAMGNPLPFFMIGLRVLGFRHRLISECPSAKANPPAPA
jgi:hypothetical protein